LGWFFIGHLFAPYLPAGQINSYIAGLILLAAAPCTAMVFVWSNLSDGEPHFTLSQVALNDTPIVGLLLGLSAITVPWETLVLSVFLYIVVPVAIAQLLRCQVLAAGGQMRCHGCSASCSLSRWSRCSPLSCCCSGIGCGVGDGYRRPDRGVRNVVGREDRQCQQGLVRAQRGRAPERPQAWGTHERAARARS
jgi:hypothetical protein